MSEKIEPGAWMIKLGPFIPESERWLHEPSNREALERAIAWAEAHPPSATDLDELERRSNE